MGVETENGQKIFYGQDLRSLFPLGLYAESTPGNSPDGRAESADSRLRSVYRDWLEESEYASQICFLDITFGPETGEFKNSTLRTIILAPNQDAMTAYRKGVLDQFFLRGASLAAHPVFRAGLPIFKLRKKPNTRDRRTFAEELKNTFQRMPQTNEELQECNSPEDFELIDDGFLSEQFAPAAVKDSHTKPPQQQFSTNIFGTFTGSDMESGGVEVDRQLSQVWQEFTGLLRANTSQLLSRRNKILGSVFALPLGLRDTANPRHLSWSWIADIYVGFDCETTEQDAQRFIRQLLLHLLRANSILKTKRETLEYMLRSFGHEVKRVTRLISPAWVVPARSLVEIPRNSQSQLPSLPQTTIGQLTLSEEFSSLADEQILLAPFGRLLRAAQQTIDLWSWQNSYNNVPQTLDQYDESSPVLGWLPRTWEKLMCHAWKLARDQRIMNDIGGDFSVSPANLLKIQHRLRADLQSFDNQAPIFNPKVSVPESMQGEIFQWRLSDFVPRKARDWEKLQERDTQRIKASFGLLRVLVAWFANCVQHGDRNSPIEVELKINDPAKTAQPPSTASRKSAKLERTRYVMTITNQIAPRTETKRNTQAATKPSSTLYSAQLALEDLDGAVQNAKEGKANKYVFSCSFYWH